jgi:23S rRNA (pseudouridine1915-N3)-methyltransferase
MASRLRIHAVGTRMPPWVSEGFEDYRKRLPRDYAVELREVPVSRRAGERAIEEEGVALLAQLTAQDHVVALEVEGHAWSSRELAIALRGWRDQGQSVAFLIGGPEGLSANCRARADARWSLSRLTLPHALARIVVIEQLYRAWTILHSHPYHR